MSTSTKSRASKPRKAQPVRRISHAVPPSSQRGAGISGYRILPRVPLDYSRGQ